jgi:calcineurin-like phosphoesterase family protein
MNQEMISRWNSIVSDDDTVIVAGDFSFGDKERIKNILSQLNGRKVLIKGNHDRHGSNFYREVGFVDFYKHSIVLHDGIVISHEPLKRKDGSKILNIHGHVHNTIDNFDGDHFNVSAEILDYYPIEMKEIRKYFQKYYVLDADKLTSDIQ